MKTIKINKIDASYASDISILLTQSPKDYIKYFHPFNFDITSVKSNMEKVKNDIFFGIFVDQKIVGFYMLRGWDEGYDVPAYGVFISPDYNGLGLGKLTIQHAISFCRVNQIKKIMLKVYPDNLLAKRMYEAFGFIRKSIDKKNNNLIYFKEL